ncbi:hypothetical protein EC844_1464 [Acinetobacter calcoaceticus]|uniref:Uncharacterized protein n=1 Tax=Acinetobacter calcoaceticus TaxID=471 RepID=A0A4R1XD84_ACICA|nr:hypothetical protein EC844_1464 [Acinetobacter calcoaceticus]
MVVVMEIYNDLKYVYMVLEINLIKHFFNNSSLNRRAIVDFIEIKMS